MLCSKSQKSNSGMNRKAFGKKQLLSRKKQVKTEKDLGRNKKSELQEKGKNYELIKTEGNYA